MTATARRGHGEGSVYRDAANGTWVGAISLGTVGFVEPMSDPGRLERQVSTDLLSFMTDLLAADQVPPPG